MLQGSHDPSGVCIILRVIWTIRDFPLRHHLLLIHNLFYQVMNMLMTWAHILVRSHDLQDHKTVQYMCGRQRVGTSCVYLMEVTPALLDVYSSIPSICVWWPPAITWWVGGWGCYLQTVELTCNMATSDCYCLYFIRLFVTEWEFVLASISRNSYHFKIFNLRKLGIGCFYCISIIIVLRTF